MEVKFPGVMAIVVAPLVDQFNVVLVPELMPEGFAEKDEIVGAFPGGGLTAFFVVAQLTRPKHASEMRKAPQRFCREEFGFQLEALLF